MKEYRDKLYSMDLGDLLKINGSYVKRVPGGWIFYNHDESAMCFVPYIKDLKY